jgi:competence transcription factor ComK
MGRGKSGHPYNCPQCGEQSDSVASYKTRKLQHYTINGISIKEIPVIVFRCKNERCERKTFTHHVAVSGIEELEGRNRYTKSSKTYAANRLLKRQVSYNSFQSEIKETLGGRTSLSTLHRWVSCTQVEDVGLPKQAIEVLHTDEKHPSKKSKRAIRNTS